MGAHDHSRIQPSAGRLETEAAEGTTEEKTPYFRVLQTSSSHEPFEVPFRRLENDRLNAFAYTDSCAGDFVRQFRELPQWKNTVIVFVPDHLGAYPEHIDNLSVERYRIPLLMVGGAIREPRRIDVYARNMTLQPRCWPNWRCPMKSLFSVKICLIPLPLISRSLPYPMLSVW